MKIAIAISSLSGGGAERAAAIMAEYFLHVGHKIHVVTLFGPETDFYPLPPGIHRIALNLAGPSSGLWNAITNNIKRLMALRRVLRSTRPDVIISFIDRMNILVLLAMMGTRIPIIVSEQMDPSQISCGMFWRMLRRCLYSRAVCLVSISHGVDRNFSWLPASKRKVIHNPLAAINLPSGKTPAVQLERNKKHVISMGRLTAQKGFDLLITAFAELASKFPDWNLCILGEGKQRSELVQIIGRLSLQSRVSLLGRHPDPFSILQRADVYVMSSRAEGFGNALIEAMACGLAAISFDCPSGPGEIIRNGVDGILVPPQDVHALASAMAHLMSNPQERARLASEAIKVGDRFGADHVMKQWNELFIHLGLS